MKTLLAALAVIVAMPAFAHHRGDPVVMMDKQELSDNLNDLDSQLNDIARRVRRRDRGAFQMIQDLRDKLSDMKDDLDAAPTPRWSDHDRDDFWSAVERHDHQWGWDRDGRDGRRDEVVVVQQPQPPQVVVTAPPQPTQVVYTQPQQQPGQPPPGGQVVVVNQQPGMVYPMADPALNNLVRAIHQESFPNDRLRVLTQAAPANYFVVAQVQQVLKQFDFGRDRLQAVRILKPRILDMENSYQLYASFDFPNEKAELKTIIGR